MAPVRFGLVGSAYRSQSLPADAQTCINLYPEQDESGAGNAPIILLPTPGTRLCVEFATGGNSSSSFDAALVGGIGDAVPTFTLGPLAPSHPNEWFVYSLNSSAATMNSGWTALGAHLQSFQRISSSPVTAIATVAPSSGSDVLAAFFSLNGVAPAIANANDVSAGQPPFSPFVSTYTLGFSGPTTPGNSILVIVHSTASDGSDFPPLITDSQGNTYTRIASTFAPGGSSVSRGTALYLASNIVGGPPSLIITVHSIRPGGGFVGSGTTEAMELTPLGTAPSTPTRGSLTITGRTFYVCGGGFFELMSNCSFVQRGSVANDSLPVTMAASPQQLLVASAGTAYVFDLMANTLTPIPGATFAGPVSQCAICDDFFIVTIKDSKQFVVSAVLDALDWVTNGAAIVSVFPDNIIGMLVSHRQIIFASDTKTVWYYDSGNIFPFDVIPGSDMDQGLAAMSSQALLGDTVLWLGADERGHGKVYKASGYTPQRVSTHAIEFAIQSYSRIDDAVVYTYQDQGHDFYSLYFPTPSVNWTLDLATGMWHQQLFNVVATGQFQAARRWNHTFNFGKHLVGDWGSGKVYEMHIPVQVGTAWSFADDDGTAIIRERIAPHISKSQQRQYFNELQVLVQVGLGPQPPLLDGAGLPRAPQMTMFTSKDFGNTWDNGRTRDCGLSGQFSTRVRWLRLGEARDLLIKLRMSDPIAWRIVDSYIDYEDGTN